MSQYRMAARIGEAVVAKYPADGLARKRLALTYQSMGDLEARIARSVPASSPKRTDGLRAACTDYRLARENYLENERRGGGVQEGRKDSQKLARDMQVCETTRRWCLWTTAL